MIFMLLCRVILLEWEKILMEILSIDMNYGKEIRELCI
nr:MAG TPA: hypothetical protein [Crassvirales sp.]